MTISLIPNPVNRFHLPLLTQPIIHSCPTSPSPPPPYSLIVISYTVDSKKINSVSYLVPNQISDHYDDILLQGLTDVLKQDISNKYVVCGQANCLTKGFTCPDFDKDKEEKENNRNKKINYCRSFNRLTRREALSVTGAT
ncbi:MAG: hypothetical protein Barrevirus10_13 [Barrevirus sp.]|uniref:Uncharacterized protein n=1 Tax=Barrevirus sp. TaxID=2487763 RepID=A0A3G4ZQB1_9VIRU|nr:MAG: hypothetical protein Barrevirus10_13 [Barrevirus sp.]